MKTQTFLNRKTVFDLREFDDFYSRERPGKATSRRALLKYYVRTGRVKPVRKGLYLSKPPGIPVVADPYLICAKMAPDAVSRLSHGPRSTTARSTPCATTMSAAPARAFTHSSMRDDVQGCPVPACTACQRAGNVRR